MKFRMLLVAGLAMAAGVAEARVKPVEPAAKPPAAPVKPVSETYFGTTLVDPYRYMETPGDPETMAWLTAQGEHTRSVLDAIPARKAYLEKMAAFGGAFGAVRNYAEYGGRAFYLEREPGAAVFDLKVRDANGTVRKIVDVAALIAASGEPHAVNYATPSPDGRFVAAGVSKGGSEDASLTVYDAGTGKAVAGPISRAQFGFVTWKEDSSGLFFNRLQELPAGAPKSERYLNTGAMYWDLKSEPALLAGSKASTGPKIDPIAFIGVDTAPGSKTALLTSTMGVENEVDLYAAPLASAATGRAEWRKLVDRKDGVTRYALRGDELFLLSHDDAPTFKLLKLSASRGELAKAETVIPAREGRLIEGVIAASDATYVQVREGLYSKLLRLPAGGGAVEEVALPFKGSIEGTFADPREPGVVIALDGWIEPLKTLRYDPSARKFTDLKLGVTPPFDPARYVALDLQATSHDGTKVPLSVVTAAGPKTPRPLLLEAYGSYGISSFPYFNFRAPPFIDAGGARAECHVRGGGELGEAWRLGGKDANKPNTWKDLFACAETLIREGYTTREQLTVIGGSAGGIPMGRSIVERPDLFAGVISVVPMASAIRAEFQTNGPANIPEFGTVKDEQGFKNLLAMDGYYTMKDGTKYPAVLFTGGMNDPRVDYWQPAKAAARLQATGSPNPVLLRIETAGGHGIGSTKTQRDEEEADFAAFVFWRAGAPEWQPTGR